MSALNVYKERRVVIANEPQRGCAKSGIEVEIVDSQILGLGWSLAEIVVLGESTGVLIFVILDGTDIPGIALGRFHAFYSIFPESGELCVDVTLRARERG